MEKAISVHNVSKKYKLYHSTKERILDLMSPKGHGDDFYALSNVNFEANKGETIGFIGINGSGKSTLSNIVAGIVPQTAGTVNVNGQASLIAVAAGLKGDLTGRDNIELKCLMLGFSKEEIKALEPAIIEFAELEQFIDQPVKSYSSGMKSRLGFAISVNVDPDILLIDEALSVGDKAFAKKSLDKMKEFKEYGKTMVFVSHSIGQMKEFCEKILWLEFGMVREFGPVEEVIPNYERFLSKWQEMNKKERELYRTEVQAYQHKITHGLNVSNLTNPWEEKSELNSDVINQYYEVETSRLGHIKGKKSYIYPSPSESLKGESSDNFKHNVYYIKKEANHQGNLYYLLSTQPSAINGIIGWMKQNDISSHVHLVIDNDKKEFHIKGSGKAYKYPWGGKENIVIDDLEQYKNYKFVVDQTDKVGNNIWYRGLLNGKKVWLHKSHLSDKII